MPSRFTAKRIAYPKSFPNFFRLSQVSTQLEESLE